MALPVRIDSHPELLRDRPLSRRLDEVSRGPSTTLTLLMMVSLTAVAAVLRLWNSGSQSLRLDEGFSLRYASLPLQPVVQGHHVVVQSLFLATAADVHPPGYLLLLHFWMQVFGTNLAVLRLPSEIAGILSVPALFLLATSLYDRRVGIFASLIGAFSPFWIWHSQEVRMYSFLLLFTILSTFGLVDGLKRKSALSWAVYFVASLLAIYTQYFAFLILFAQAIFVLLHVRQFGRSQFITWVGLTVGLGVAYLPWAAVLITHYHGASDPNLGRPDLYTPLTMMSDFLLGYLSVPLTSAVVAAWPLLVPLALALGIFAGAASRQGSALWLLFLLPIVVSFVITLVYKPFLSERYLIVATPALYILAAIAVTRLRGQVAKVAIAIGISAALLLAWRIGETSAANPNTEDYRTVAAYIDTHARPGDVVALDSFFNNDAYSYTVHDNLPTYDLPLPPSPNGVVPALTTSKLASYLSQITAGRKRLWVVYYLETNYDRGNLVRHYLAYNTAGHSVIFGGPYGRNQDRYPESFRSVQLVRYQLIPRKTSVQQPRPATTQQLRALTHLGPSLRLPFASPFGSPDAIVPMRGEPEAIPLPVRGWTLATTPGHELAIFNPNPNRITVLVRSVSAPKVVHTVHVPSRTNLDVNLGPWGTGFVRASLTFHSNGPIVVARHWANSANAWTRFGKPLPSKGIR